MTAQRGQHRLRERGSDLGIEVSGPDVVACLAAAVEGLAAAVADVGADAPRRRVPVAVTEHEPADLLVGVLEEVIVLLDTDGVLATHLVDARVDAPGLRGVLEVVALDDVRVRGPAPKAVTWHEVSLEPADDGWQGAVMIDL